jgi:hypothetical protein
LKDAQSEAARQARHTDARTTLGAGTWDANNILDLFDWLKPD